MWPPRQTPHGSRLNLETFFFFLAVVVAEVLIENNERSAEGDESHFHLVFCSAKKQKSFGFVLSIFKL